MEFVETDVGGDAVQVRIDSKALACPVCGNDTFHERNSLMNTKAAAFFKVDWINPQATNYICIQCGYVFWFLR